MDWQWQDWLTFVAALGCGLNAGMFYAFSSFVMRALGNLEPREGIAAMQRINIDVIYPRFMLVFMGTPLLCVAIVGEAVWHWGEAGATLRMIGGLTHVSGNFGVKVAFNVPWNDRLAQRGRLPAEGTEGEALDLWSRYLRVCEMWNTVRTAAALVACCVLILALCN